MHFSFRILPAAAEFFSHFISLLNLQGHCYKLVTKRSRLEVRQNFFSHRFVGPWNRLPSNIVEATTVNSSKTDFTGRREGHRKASEVRQDME